MSAVIVVPGQGMHANAFAGTARGILDGLYKGGTAYQTQLARLGSGSFSVNFNACSWNPASKRTDFWTAVSTASTFVLMAHYGEVDGPILNHVDTGNDAIPSVDRWWQPWPKAEGLDCLTLPGILFWCRVGALGRTNTVKIVLAGCKSSKIYAPLVARVAMCDVYGFKDSQEVANPAVMIPILRAIEAGTVPKRMEKIKLTS